MNKEQKEDLAHIVLATIQLQSVIHTLDNVTGNNDFVKAKKMRYNNFINHVKRFVALEEMELYGLIEAFGKDSQSQNYVDCVNEFDKLAETVSINFFEDLKL